MFGLAIEGAARASSAWRVLGGELLEPALAHDGKLGGSPVRLLDSRFLVELADSWLRTEASRSAAKLCRRQELPEAAFLPLDRLQRWRCGYGGALRILVVSHPWRSAHEPDPSGETLRLVAHALGVFMAHKDRKKAIDRGPYGVFIDFCCLMQIGPEARRLSPSAPEVALHLQGVRSVGALFSHPNTVVLKLTAESSLPAEARADAHAAAPYAERGWCACEAAMAGMKEPELVLDLGKLAVRLASRGAASAAPPKAAHKLKMPELVRLSVSHRLAARAPPLTPTEFSRGLARAAFRRDDDRPLVQSMYERALAARLGGAACLDYSHRAWGEKEFGSVAGLIAHGSFSQVRSLNVGHNDLGDEGLALLAAAMGRPSSVVALEELDLHSCHVGRRGVAALLRGLSSGALPSLSSLQLNANPLGYAGVKSIADAIRDGTAAGITSLFLSRCDVGDEGVDALGAALVSRLAPSEAGAPRRAGTLRKLHLSGDGIGDHGMATLATAVAEGAFSSCVELHLHKNVIGDEGVEAIARASQSSVSGGLASLLEIDLDENSIGNRGAVALSAAMSQGAMSQVQRLYLRGNRIGDDGMRALVGTHRDRARRSSLEHIRLGSNPISELGLAMLIDVVNDGRREGSLARCLDVDLDDTPAMRYEARPTTLSAAARMAIVSNRFGSLLDAGGIGSSPAAEEAATRDVASPAAAHARLAQSASGSLLPLQPSVRHGSLRVASEQKAKLDEATRHVSDRVRFARALERQDEESELATRVK